MIRTQIYIPEDTHTQLLQLAKAKSSSMAEITREFIEEGLKKEKNADNTGIKTLQALSNLNLKGGPKDLSKNLDHYLYGGPKKK
ncbi:hypothetical protein MUP32_00840 [Candidatus Microgenomates bacterium]|nr:hypothetical protein [Candidatus Microgenomates bacterium]